MRERHGLMAKKAAEFPVSYQGRAATLSFGETAVRLFDRTSYALFKTFMDPTVLSVSVAGESLEVTDGIDQVLVSEDGVPLDEVAMAFDAGGRPIERSTTTIPIATVDSIAGREIAETIGIVSGSAVMSVAVFDRLSGGTRGALDGRSEAYGQDLSTTRRMAFAEMRAQAETGNADAVVSVTVAHETVGRTSEYLLVTATGTAVRFN